MTTSQYLESCYPSPPTEAHQGEFVSLQEMQTNMLNNELDSISLSEISAHLTERGFLSTTFSGVICFFV